MKKRNFSEKFEKFMDGKGFYIALVLCLAMIGGSGYYLIQSFRTAVSVNEEPVSGPVVVRAEPSESAETETPTAEESTPIPESEPPEAASAAVVTEPAETEEAAVVTFTNWPVEGTTVAAFSPDVLVKNETMGDWRVHEGIDLAAEIGAPVLAVADGTVERVYTDHLLGTVITVRHGEEFTGLYGGLDSDVPVAEGDAVTGGTAIGTVGASCPGEAALGTHVHFALTRAGAYADPADFLPGLPDK